MACMARIVFTQQLRRFTEHPNSPARPPAGGPRWGGGSPQPGGGWVWAGRGGHAGQRVRSFMEGGRCTDRVKLADALAPDSEVHVLQALSGG